MLKQFKRKLAAGKWSDNANNLLEFAGLDSKIVANLKKTKSVQVSFIKDVIMENAEEHVLTRMCFEMLQIVGCHSVICHIMSYHIV